MIWSQEDVRVVAASVDPVQVAGDLAEDLRLRHVTMIGELDGEAVAARTGASVEVGDRTFLHATGFVVDPQGQIVVSVYSSGPIGRFTASDVIKKVVFEKQLRAMG